MSKTLNFFSNKKKINDVIIVGSCLGGLVGEMLSTKYPDIAKALILIGTIGVQGGADLFLNDKQVPMKSDDLASSQVYQSMVSNRTYSLLSDNDYQFDIVAKDVLWALFNINISPERNYYDVKGTNEIEKIKVPILAIHGTDDEVVPISHARAIYNILGTSKCSFATIRNAGHFPWQDDLSSTIVPMKEFFEETVPKVLYEYLYNFNLNQKEDKAPSVFISFSFITFVGALFTCILGFNKE